MKRLPLSLLVLSLLAAPAAPCAAQADASQTSPNEAATDGVAAGVSTADEGASPSSYESEAVDEDAEHHNFLHGGVRLVREHAIAFGFHHTYLRAFDTVAGNPNKVYNFVAPSVAYSFYRGHRFGFLMNLEWFFPIHGWQLDADDCPSGCSTRQLYDQTLGYDATFMFAYHDDLMENLSLNAGIGLHANIVELSDAELRDFNNISMGIGTLTTVRYYFNEKVDFGGNLSLSVDWADMIHETGVLRYTINWALSATIGIHR